MPRRINDLNTIYTYQAFAGDSCGQISRCTLTTVVAPMGYGKTSL